MTGFNEGATPGPGLSGSLLLRQRPSRGIVTGLAVGMAGVVLIALPTMNEGRSSVDGVLLILAALVSYGFALNLARPLQMKYGALPVIWRAQAVAGNVQR